MAGQFVEGVGDEVVLFAAFLFFCICMLLYISLRGRQGRATGRPEPQQQQHDESDEAEDNRNDTDLMPGDVGISANLGNTAGGDVTNRGSSEIGQQLSDDRSQHHVETEEPSVRSRFPQAQGTGITEEDSSLLIRLILPNNSTLSVDVQLSTTLGELRIMYFQEQLAEHRPVRFIYRGGVLNNDAQTMRDLEIGPQHAIHVHIGNPQPPNTEGSQNFGPQSPAEMMDISHLFFPLFGLILAICWVCMFCYPNIFSLLTKVLLFILSIGYVFMAYASTRSSTQ